MFIIMKCLPLSFKHCCVWFYSIHGKHIWQRVTKYLENFSLFFYPLNNIETSSSRSTAWNNNTLCLHQIKLWNKDVEIAVLNEIIFYFEKNLWKTEYIYIYIYAPKMIHNICETLLIIDRNDDEGHTHNTFQPFKKLMFACLNL